MLRMILALTTMSLCLSDLSSAQVLPETPWTAQEHASLAKLVEGCDQLISAVSRAASDWGREPNPEASRASYARTVRTFSASAARCVEASQYLFGAKSDGSRPVDVAKAKSLVGTTLQLGDRGIAEMPAGASKSGAVGAVARIRGFDPSRAYARYAGAEQPRMIASHGDYRFAMESLGLAQTKLGEALQHLGVLMEPSKTPRFSANATQYVAGAISKTGASLSATLHAASLSAFVITGEDFARISGDAQASGGIRDKNFFRAVLSLEYAFCCGTAPPVFSGRQRVLVAVPNSMFSATQDVSFAVHRGTTASLLARLNGPAWMAQQMDRTLDGAVGEYYAAMFEAWQAVDNFGFGVMGFFHPVPGPSLEPVVTGDALLPEAPWSVAEHESLLRMVRGCEGIADATAEAMTEWANDGRPPEAQRAIYARAAAALGYGFYHCSNGAFKLFGAPNRARRERSRDVRDALMDLREATRRANLAIGMLPNGGRAEVKALAAVSSLVAVDTRLGYVNWQPEDYPRLIGLHGDYDSSQARLAHGVRYLAHALWDLGRLADPDITPRFSQFARTKIAEATRHTVASSKASFRAAALEAFVVTPEDWQRIQQDTLAGRGLRPPSFFRSILALEYAFDRSGPPFSLSRRSDVPFSFPNSLTKAFQALSDGVHNSNGATETLVALNGPSWLAEVMNRNGIQIGTVENHGMVGEFYGDSFDLWAGVDNYGWAVMGFFHGVPSRPGQ